MKRREFITGAALAAPSIALGAKIAVNHTDDPLPAMVNEWFRLRREMDEAFDAAKRFSDANGYESATSHALDVSVDEPYERQSTLGRQICATPAKTPEGLRAQLRYFISDHGEDFATYYGGGFEKLVPTLAAGLDNTETGDLS